MTCWLKLAGEKIRRKQDRAVPTFLSVRANKFAKWKTGLSPFSTRRICSRDAKRKQEFSNVIGWRKSSLLRQPITLPDSCFRFASREQIRLVENGLYSRFQITFHCNVPNFVVKFGSSFRSSKVHFRIHKPVCKQRL